MKRKLTQDELERVIRAVVFVYVTERAGKEAKKIIAEHLLDLKTKK